MASRVMLTGQVKRARGGATWLLTEEIAEAAGGDENMSPNMQQASAQWEKSFSRLQIGEATDTESAVAVQDKKGIQQSGVLRTWREEEARVRRLVEQYRLPTKELIGTGSQDEDSLQAILKRQKQLLAELQSQPLGALYPPAAPGPHQQSQEGNKVLLSTQACTPAFKAADSKSDGMEGHQQKNDVEQKSDDLAIIADTSDFSRGMPVLHTHQKIASGVKKSAEDSSCDPESGVEIATGRKAPLFTSRRPGKLSLQPSTKPKTTRCPSSKSSCSSSVQTNLKEGAPCKQEQDRNAKVNGQGSRVIPWSSSSKPALSSRTVVNVSRSFRAGGEKPRQALSGVQEQHQGKLQDRSEVQRRDVQCLEQLPTCSSHNTETSQEKHVMVFASQPREWEEEISTMAGEPTTQHALWNNQSSTSVSRSESASSQGQKEIITGSEGENGIGRYTMNNLTDVQKVILTVGGKVHLPSVKNEKLVPSRKEIRTRSSRKSRRLSQVLRSEDELLRQNEHNAVELQSLQYQLDEKDNEVNSVRTAGMLLQNLYHKQSEELKALKASYPATFKETAELRELCKKQEHSLRLGCATVSSYKSQVLSLTSELASLRNVLAKVNADKDFLLQKLEQGEKAVNWRTLNNGSMHPRYNEQMFQEQCVSTQHLRKNCHKANCSLQPSGEQQFPKAVRKIGDKLLTDQELGEMLGKLHSYADREQALLQERCAKALHRIRHSSLDNVENVNSRFGKILCPVARPD